MGGEMGPPWFLLPHPGSWGCLFPPPLRNSLMSKARNTTSLVLKREGTDLKILEVERGDGRGEGRAVGSPQAPVMQVHGPQLQGPRSGIVLDSVFSGPSSRLGSDSAQGYEVVMRAQSRLWGRQPKVWREMEVNSILKRAGVQWAALLEAEKRAGSTAWGGGGSR